MFCFLYGGPFGPSLVTFSGVSFESSCFCVVLQYNCHLKPVAEQFYWGAEVLGLTESGALVWGWPGGNLPGVLSSHLFPGQKVRGAFFLSFFGNGFYLG